MESMVYNAVSLHTAGKLSMDAFKSDIFNLPPGLDGHAAGPVDAAVEHTVFPDPLPTLKQTELLLVDEALRRSGGNQAIAAMMLGITRQALNKRLKKTADAS
jgi:DNA-binding NtrC family response regulator